MPPLADLIAPALSALTLLAAGTLLGYWPAKKVITIGEARHGLKQGSASQLRAFGGWVVIAFWLAALWFGGTIIGDWGATGDLEGAVQRSWFRLRVLLEILAAFSD